MPLIERLAIIGVNAQAHFRAAASPNLRKPVGIRERLARERDDVRLTRGQHVLGLFEVVDAARGNQRRRKVRRAQGGADAGGCTEVAAERTLHVGIIRRHAFITAASGIGIGRRADLGLLRIVEFSAAR